MDKIAHFFINNPKLTTIFSIFILIGGWISLENINAETNPAVDFATAIITTNYAGASSKEIETRITKPIEDEIRQVSDIKDIRSVSQPGLSTIIVRIDMDKKGVDVKESMVDLQRAIDRTSNLPSDLVNLPRFTEIKSEEFPVVTLAVTGSNENRFRDFIADILKDEIQDNKGVKSVSLDGYKERRFNVDLQLDKMKSYHIGINELASKIRDRNIDIPSGEIKGSQLQFLTRIEAKIKNIEDLANIDIRSNFSGKTVKLKDVAVVTDGEDETRILSRYNGEPATILTINKKANVDTIELVEDIKHKIVDFSKRYEGKLEFHFIHDESKEVRNRLTILTGNALIGLAIVIVLLVVFLPWRIGFLTAMSFPIVMGGTMILMFLLGINLNTVTIMGLVIVGMLVDDVRVIVGEDFTRYRHEGIPPIEASLRAIKVLWLPIMVSTLTIVAAFLPMMLTKGIMGAFIKWIPIVISLTLIVSLFECFCFLPMRLAYFGGKVKILTKEDAKKDWFHKFELKFEQLVLVLIRFRYLVLVGFFAVIALSVFLLFVANKFILFPAEQTLIYVTKFQAKDGSKIENTSEVMRELSLKIKNVLGDGAQHIVGKAGVTDINASQPNYKEGSNVGYMWIYVDDYTKDNVPYNQVLSKLRTIKSDNINELIFEAQVNGPPVGNAIEATIRSNSFSDIDKAISLITDDLKKVKGITDLTVDDIVVGDEIFVNIDYEKVSQLGLDIDKIGSAVRSAIAGTIVSQVTIDNKEVDLFIRFKDNFRTSIDDLKKIMIMDKADNLVPLGNFASFEQKESEPYIKRYDYKKSKSLNGNVDDKIISPSQANQIIRDLFDRHKDQFPSVSITFGGIEESTNESLDSLKRAFIFSIMGIFILLVFLFKSYTKPFIILTTIPLGLLGFGVAFLLHGKPVSFVALIGLIGLSGVIVNTGIILISYILNLEEERKGDHLHKVLAYASSMRLRSVVITALTTMAGFAPSAYGVSGKDEILSPMTLVMTWGLASSTFLTVIWIPCAYAIIDDFKRSFKNLFDKYSLLLK